MPVGPSKPLLDQPGPEAVPSLHAGDDALRVQAAAVAAQHAALTDEEARLDQRRAALERQERQLAAHFDDRRRELDAEQRRLEIQSATVQAERAAASEDRAIAARERAAAEARRQRLLQLGPRLQRHWQRQRHEREADLARRERAVAAEQKRLEQERAAGQQQVADARTARLRFNAQVELTRRQQEHDWAELAQAISDWEEGQYREEQALADRKAELEARAAALAADAEDLAVERRNWESRHRTLQEECTGLEARADNLRAALAALERHRGTLTPQPVADAPPPATAVSVVAPTVPAPVVLTRVAGDLADQRCLLVDQWQQLLELQTDWRQDQCDSLAILEDAACRFLAWEKQLQQQDGELQELRKAVARQQSAISCARTALEVRHSRLNVQEATWQAERDRLRDALHTREAAAAFALQQIEQLRQQCLDRQRRDRDQLRAAHARLRAARCRYAEVWREERKRRASIGKKQRTLAIQALALEQLRQELVARAPNAVAAERRLARLSQREETLRARAERELRAGQQALQAESQRLDELARLLGDGEKDLLQRQFELNTLQAEVERRQTALTADEQRLLADRRTLTLRHEHDQQQLAALRDEIERIAHLLLSDDASLAPPARAA